MRTGAGNPAWKGGTTPEQKAAYGREWRKKNEHRVRDREYRKRFGISLEDYQAMLDQQGGCCAICFKKPKRRRLNVDHCHKTGVVRGLLCDICNAVLGLLEDSPEVLTRAASYLQESRYVSRALGGSTPLFELEDGT